MLPALSICNKDGGTVNISKQVPISEQENRAEVLSLSGELDQSRPITELRLSNGSSLSLPTRLLLQHLQVEAELKPAFVDEAHFGEERLLPIIEERLEVNKRSVTTGSVQLLRSTEEHTETVDIPLTSVTFEVTRQPVNRMVSERPVPRTDGETTVYSIVEERVVVSTELILKEEVHVTRRERVTNDQQLVTLRRDRLDISRSPAR